MHPGNSDLSGGAFTLRQTLTGEKKKRKKETRKKREKRRKSTPLIIFI